MRDLIGPQPAEIQRFLAASNLLENAADIVETGFVYSGRRRLELDLEFPPELADPIRDLHRASVAIVRAGIEAFVNNDSSTATEFHESREDFIKQLESTRLILGRTVAGAGHKGVRIYRIGMDCLENLRRLISLTRRLLTLVEGAAPLDSPEVVGGSEAN